MELAVNIGLDGALPLARAAEELGYRTVLASDNFRSDALTVLSCVASHTRRIGLLPGVLQLPARSPAATATAAASLHVLSQGRFSLGLGVSNPDVSEGWHGVAFEHPLGRLREYVTIVRRALAGEEVRFSGEHFRLPAGDRHRNTPLRLGMAPGDARVPVYLGASSPGTRRLAGEIADGWIGAFTTPEDVADAVTQIGRGSVGGTKRPFDVLPCAATYIDDSVERAAAALRTHYAGLLGVGDPATNFFCRLLRRYGFADAPEEIHARMRAGDRAAAAAAVPLEFIDMTALVGPPRRVAARMRRYADAGASCLGIMITAAQVETPEKIRQLSEAKRAHALFMAERATACPPPGRPVHHPA
ncbi:MULTISPECIES: LLM class flavin-dependent oxidoreductase [Streptomyces]|uniref:F420-dependent glucose-6-phosphate dehydrogenase n=1 Tax=Streptomyces chartreusis NRRL 3882 TaxID=1079985 RepID=A0A2N9B3A7_STRCX|nr:MULTISPECIES: LLM class flavin-dependent oxidoreductase [Streptomyces]MYS89695.1 LLM class flavin-dependent oxidoreductase [Streptomyces sp. SID5464]SOR77820.1 F420-dependent glucose-6-phosphate dehydrogenase [Streptomyces chartreusis NRRL 3882]